MPKLEDGRKVLGLIESVTGTDLGEKLDGLSIGTGKISELPIPDLFSRNKGTTPIPGANKSQGISNLIEDVAEGVVGKGIASVLGTGGNRAESALNAKSKGGIPVANTASNAPQINPPTTENFDPNDLPMIVRERYSASELEALSKQNVVTAVVAPSGPAKSEDLDLQDLPMVVAKKRTLPVTVDAVVAEIAELQFPDKIPNSVVAPQASASPLERMRAGIEERSNQEIYQKALDVFCSEVKRGISDLFNSGVGPLEIIEAIGAKIPFKEKDLRSVTIHNLVADEIKNQEIRKLFDKVKDVDINETSGRDVRTLKMVNDLNELQVTLQRHIDEGTYTAKDIKRVAQELFPESTSRNSMILFSVQGALGTDNP